MSNVLDGKSYAQQLKKLIAQEVECFSEKIQPKLAIIQVGDNDASRVYVREKLKQATTVGIEAHHIHLDAQITEPQMLELIHRLNLDNTVNGIIVQLPLPSHLNPANIVNAIHPMKDVDGLSFTNMGCLSMGLDGLVPCTPLGCIILLQQIFESLDGKHAVVIGRSNLVGKSMALLLLRKNCTISVVHSKSLNPEKIVREADIIVSAVGKAKLVTKDWVKKGAVVLDVGISRQDEVLSGDVDFQSVQKVAYAITPVPGGVGPMTVACLLLNTVLATARQKKITLKILTQDPVSNKICL